MSSALILILSVLLDRVLGEFRRWHPLAGFGQLANRIEVIFYPATPANEPPLKMRLRGAAAMALLILPPALVACALAEQPMLGKFVEVALLYLAIGARSLEQHARAVSQSLDDGDLLEAQRRVSKIVSRDTSSLDQVGIIRATVESVLENGNDAVFAPVFWFLLLGAPGVVLYRLANTLDAMWGYRNEKYENFGWAAARLDDLLNWVPARLTALTYTVLGNTRCAWHCWRSQGRLWYSPNAGPVMAAGAGALEVELGGPAIYHGREKDRPTLGQGRAPIANDIGSSLELVNNGLLIWVALSVLGGLIHA